MFRLTAFSLPEFHGSHFVSERKETEGFLLKGEGCCPHVGGGVDERETGGQGTRTGEGVGGGEGGGGRRFSFSNLIRGQSKAG